MKTMYYSGLIESCMYNLVETPAQNFDILFLYLVQQYVHDDLLQP